jgi:hypothetical protein
MTFIWHDPEYSVFSSKIDALVVFPCIQYKFSFRKTQVDCYFDKYKNK